MGEFVLVTGPESSGTKLITRILIEMGYKGEYTHEQTLDKLVDNNVPLKLNNNPKDHYVLRRSVPHYKIKQFPDYAEIKDWAISNKLKFKTIITFRNAVPCLLSKVLRKHNEALPDYTLLMDQFTYIAENIYMLRPFLVVSTSFLTVSPQRSLFEIANFLQKDILTQIDCIYDMDEKHYPKEMQNDIRRHSEQDA